MMECSDGHRCENGSVCTENPYDEGAFYCDCDESMFDQAYAGLYCEHEATTYCTFNQEVSKISFCTNGGTCKADVTVESAHLGCDCPPNYDGEHCQFVLGTKPDGWPYDGSSQPPSTFFGYPSSPRGGRTPLSPFITAVIVVIVLGVLGSLVFILWKKRLLSETHASSKDVRIAPELALDADGEVLKDAVRYGDSSSSPLNSPSQAATESELEEIQIDGSPVKLDDYDNGNTATKELI
eukprot:CAMPEP_0116836906 /NCGR_PEP_ID=MMETSP0418-20121206/8361_1 /TAXON_ID=1158023 /ORGANISM="Astrosyne radiata, Strain 13vi08-1A" /LENGTH=237 /DNA_ID=CAMNT_0004466737 /DNA_START=70 /DNA_END=786 /DNA_ORIENTATION=+